MMWKCLRSLGIMPSISPAIAIALCCAAAIDPPQARAAELAGGQALRLAVNDLIATFAGRYPQGQQYLAQLDRIESGLKAAASRGGGATGDSADEFQQQFENLRREALLANPLLSGQPLLFVVRPQYAPDHHNTETMFQTGEINTASFHGGGALKTMLIVPSETARAAAPTTRLRDVQGRRARSRRQLRRQEDPLLHAIGRRRRLSPLRDQRRRHAPEAIDLRRGHQRHRPDLPAQRPDPLHLDPRAQVLHVQPAHHGQPLHHGGRRGQHPTDRPQHAARGTCFAAARRPRPLRPLGIRRSQLRQRAGPVDDQSGRHQPRGVLRQQHRFAGREARRPRHPRHGAGDLHFLLVPRPAVGGAGDSRPAVGRGRPRAGAADLARLRPSTWSTAGVTTRSRAFNPSTRTPTRSPPSISSARG